MNTGHIEQIISAGIAAPSADNSQPWCYRHRVNCTDLWLDARRALSPSNAGYVLSDLALGAVIENMCLQARALGYSVRVRYLPDAQGAPLWVASLEWGEQADLGNDPLADAIPHRHTDRRFPFRGPTPPTALQALAEQGRRYAGTELIVLGEAAQRATALKLLRRAETLRFRYQALHAELFSHIRWEAGWHQSCTEGLPPAALAVEPPMRPLFKSLRSWNVMAALNRLGASSMLGLRSAYLPARLSPTLCLLASHSIDRIAVLNAGRALQRVWLQATLEGLAVQPYAAAGLFTLGKIALNPAFQRDIRPLQSMMQELCPPGHHGLVFLRLGYPPKSSPHRSGRRPLSGFLASE